MASSNFVTREYVWSDVVCVHVCVLCVCVCCISELYVICAGVQNACASVTCVVHVICADYMYMYWNG